ATGSLDRTARLWDAQTGRLKATLQGRQGHLAPVLTLAFSPDGQTLATGTIFDDTRLWDAHTGRLKATLPANGGLGLPPWALFALRTMVAFSPDGRVLATRSVSGRVRLWDVATGKLIPITAQTRWTDFPSEMTHPFSIAGAAVALHDPRDGRVMAT